MEVPSLIFTWTQEEVVLEQDPVSFILTVHIKADKRSLKSKRNK